MAEPLSKEIIQKARGLVICGKSKYQIAKERGLRFGVVYHHTKDLPNHVYREKGIRGKMLDIITHVKHGFFLIF